MEATEGHVRPPSLQASCVVHAQPWERTVSRRDCKLVAHYTV